MLILIDMTVPLARGQVFTFAVWDTISDNFLFGVDASQAWGSMEDFIYGFPGPYNEELVKRVRGLMPEPVCNDAG